MGKVVINEKIRHGKPIIEGTRITVEEVIKNIREVIQLCLESDKKEIPRKEFIGVQKIEVPGGNLY